MVGPWRKFWRQKSPPPVAVPPEVACAYAPAAFNLWGESKESEEWHGIGRGVDDSSVVVWRRCDWEV